VEKSREHVIKIALNLVSIAAGWSMKTQTMPKPPNHPIISAKKHSTVYSPLDHAFLAFYSEWIGGPFFTSRLRTTTLGINEFC
jgi:hypothetical protein